MPRTPGPEDGRRCDRIDAGPSLGAEAAPGCTATVAFAVVDDRPVALIFPASRRVVVERLGKLLGADNVRLAPRDEVARFLGEPPIGMGRSIPAPPGVPLLMDATLLSARALEIRPYGEEASVRLPLEDWLATANPTVGFFSEPDGGPDA